MEIPAGAKNWPLLSHDEVLAQIQLGNVLFVGSDGLGNHARIQIVDDAVRKELFGFDEKDDTPQTIITPEAVKSLLAIKTKAAFHKRLAELVTTRAERLMLVDLAFQNGAADAESWKVDALRAAAKE